MKIPMILLVSSILVGAVAFAVNSPTNSGRIEVADYYECETADDQWEYAEVAEPVVETEVESNKFPNKEQTITIGRIADGIFKIKKHEGGWWECGKLIDKDEDIRDLAIKYAHAIVKYSHEASQLMIRSRSGKYAVLNPWGLAGTVFNESNFDRCALGLHPRRKAYDLGLIQPRRKTISHTEKEVLRAVRSAKLQRFFPKSGYDLGTAQLLSRFYPRRNDFALMISLNGSTEAAAKNMISRAVYNNTERPWAYWPGHRSRRYDRRVTSRARALGATSKDI